MGADDWPKVFGQVTVSFFVDIGGTMVSVMEIRLFSDIG